MAIYGADAKTYIVQHTASQSAEQVSRQSLMPGLTIEAEKTILREKIRVLSEENDSLINQLQELKDEGRFDSERELAFTLMGTFNRNTDEKGRYRQHLARLETL